jgi:hypothetical protein
MLDKMDQISRELQFAYNVKTIDRSNADLFNSQFYSLEMNKISLKEKMCR